MDSVDVGSYAHFHDVPLEIYSCIKKVVLLFHIWLHSSLLSIAYHLGSDPKIGVCEGACFQTVSIYIYIFDS